MVEKIPGMGGNNSKKEKQKVDLKEGLKEKYLNIRSKKEFESLKKEEQKEFGVTWEDYGKRIMEYQKKEEERKEEIKKDDENEGLKTEKNIENSEKEKKEKQKIEGELNFEAKNNQGRLGKIAEFIESIEDPKDILKIKNKEDRKDALKMFQEISYKRFLATGKIREFLVDYYKNFDKTEKIKTEKVLDLLEDGMKDLYFNRELLEKYVKPILINFEKNREIMANMSKEEIKKILEENNISGNFYVDDKNPFANKVLVSGMNKKILGQKIDGSPIVVLNNERQDVLEKAQEHELEHIKYEMVHGENIGNLDNLKKKKEFLKFLSDEVLAHFKTDGHLNVREFLQNYEEDFQDYFKGGENDETERREKTRKLLEKIKDLPIQIKKITGMSYEAIQGMLSAVPIQNWESLLKKLEKYGSLNLYSEVNERLEKKRKNKEKKKGKLEEKNDEEKNKVAKRKKQKKKKSRKSISSFITNPETIPDFIPDEDREIWSGVSDIETGETYTGENAKRFAMYQEVMGASDNFEIKGQKFKVKGLDRHQKDVVVEDIGLKKFLDENKYGGWWNKPLSVLFRDVIVDTVEFGWNKVKSVWKSFKDDPIKFAWEGLKDIWRTGQIGLRYLGWFFKPSKGGLKGEIDVMKEVQGEVNKDLEAWKKDKEYQFEVKKIKLRHESIVKYLKLKREELALKVLLGPDPSKIKKPNPLRAKPEYPGDAATAEQKRLYNEDLVEWRDEKKKYEAAMKKYKEDLRKWKDELTSEIKKLNDAFSHEYEGWKRYREKKNKFKTFWTGKIQNDYSKTNAYLDRNKDIKADDVDLQFLEEEVQKLQKKLREKERI